MNPHGDALLECNNGMRGNVYVRIVCLFDFRYNTSTGEFGVPAGGAGLYYFYTYLRRRDSEWSEFQLKKNNMTLCKMYPYADKSGDIPAASCGATVELNTGNMKSTC